MEKVVNKKEEDFDTYIGRGSKWGNPFRIGDPHPESEEDMDRQQVIGLYAQWITRGEGRHLLADLHELEGRTLGCFCAPEGGVTASDPPICHGQVLLWLVARRREKRLRPTTWVTLAKRTL